MQEKLRKGSFTLDDFLEQLQQVQKMGPLGQIMGMLPGMGGMAKEAQAAIDRGEHRRVEAIIRVDDAARAPRPGRAQRVAPPPHRDRLGHDPHRT